MLFRSGFRELLTDANFSAPRKEFFSNVTGGPVSDVEQLRSLAADQIISPVRWIAEEEAIRDAGYERVAEAGPGTVLAGLWKSLSGEPFVKPAGTLEAILALAGTEGQK